MSEHYDFHYQPTGSGAISGQQVLQQTEDAINELGDYVNDNVGGAMDVAQQALETAQNAEINAQTALDTANSFSSAIQSAQQDASTALSTAQTAQTTASNANNTAIQASQDANTAVTTANNASGQVSTLSGTVTALGQRVTTAEGNIGQNTSDITALTTRVGTAEGNITTLQNDVSIAQGNASSAMATAGQVKQQAFVFRYSSTALVASSTNSNALLDNTDNLKVGDKVIDSSGVLFSITAIDTANSTFTIGTALVDLAQDSDVVHKSGDETVGGIKTFSEDIVIGNSDTTQNSKRLVLRSYKTSLNSSNPDNWGISFNAGASYAVAINASKDSNGTQGLIYSVRTQDSNNNIFLSSYHFRVFINGNSVLEPVTDSVILLGRSTNRWKSVYATNYYYGNDNVEFSTKFVTTDTTQTITYPKTFTTTPSFTGYTAIRIYSTTDDINVIPSASQVREIRFTDKNNVPISYFSFQHRSDANEPFRTCWRQCRLDGTENYYSVNFNNLGEFYPENTNGITLGTSTKRWKDCQTYQINGLEPSSLGMPSGNLNDIIDISSYITVLDNSAPNKFTPPSNGYITFHVKGSQVQFMNDYGLQVKWSVQSGSVNRGFVPVLGGVEIDIYISATDIYKFWFIPCQGNV